MSKRHLASLTALAVLGAFAASASLASATTLTQPTGTKVAAGTLLKVTTIGESSLTNLSGEVLIRCSAGDGTGEVVNAGGAGATVSGNVTAASFSGTGTSGDCTSSTGASIKVTTAIAGGLPYCLKSIEGKDEGEVRGGKCSEAARSIKFTLDATGIGTCGYEAASLKGSFTTDTSGGDATSTVSKGGPFKRYESEGLVSLFCPAEATLDFSLTLEKDEATATPIYVS